MTYKIIWDKKAKENLKKLDLFVAKRILKKINELQENPFSKDLKRLKGEIVFRLRVGDYRALVEIENNNIKVLKIGHRKNIYEY